MEGSKTNSCAFDTVSKGKRGRKNIAFLFIKCTGPKSVICHHIFRQKCGNGKNYFFFIDKSFYAAEAICKAIPAVFILGFDFRCWTIQLLSIELHFEKIYRAHLWCILFPVRGRVTVIGIAYYIHI